jgi:membrane-associated HD superfamily phosphohydrolase
LIRRVSDKNGLNEEAFNNLQKIVDKKEKYKLYDDYEDLSKATIDAKILKMQGFETNIKTSNNKYKLYYADKNKINFKTAQNSGMFKSLAWGRYSFQREESINPAFDYDFDDGSIWKLITDENGEQYLIKEVDDDGNVIRTKTASVNMKKIADNGCYIDDDNFDKIMQILYHNSKTPNQEFIDTLLNSEIKTNIYKILSEKMDKLITEKLESKNVPENNIQELTAIIQQQIDDNSIVDETTLENTIDNYIQELTVSN